MTWERVREETPPWGPSSEAEKAYAPPPALVLPGLTTLEAVLPTWALTAQGEMAPLSKPPLLMMLLVQDAAGAVEEETAVGAETGTTATAETVEEETAVGVETGTTATAGISESAHLAYGEWSRSAMA